MRDSGPGPKQPLRRFSPWSCVSAALVIALLGAVPGCKSPTGESQVPAQAGGQPPTARPPTVEELEAAVPEHPLKMAYFGETHVHTSYSLDAFIGGTRITPDEAYRFARGEEVTVNGQKKHNVGRPLDWVAVSDHAEFLGEMYSAQVPGAQGDDNPMLEELRNLKSVDEQRAWFLKYVINNMRSAQPGHPPFYAGPDTTRSAWQDVELKAVRDNYEPGTFTTLAGFEWTAARDAGNMHRNILFRDLTVPELPLSALDTNDEEKLWAWMSEQEKKGSKLLAIPHNSNGSKGYMFEAVDNAGAPLTAGYAQARSHFERLIEVMQIKGNSEVHRTFWPADEFADFENADSVATFNGRTFRKENFVRWAVTKGLAYQQKFGANPFQLGFIGGTDNHNGLPADTAEDDYIGSHGPADGTLEARREGEIDGWIKARDSNPGSLSGVWATRNTRAAIWDAMAARESFATSGTRITVRFFGGPDLPAASDARALVEQGYKAGVPMGGTISAASKAPTFTFWAVKDPDGANLDRLQIIKGWVDATGEPHDTVIDVAWSGTRKLDKDGRIPAVGNTVDVRTATYVNTIGSAELMGAWTDPDFDPNKPALYYLRVLEIPTPRWTTYDAARHKLPLLPDVPASIQERAYTSPIWYIP